MGKLFLPLFITALLGIARPSAFGQSPWVELPGPYNIFNWQNASILSLHAPQPDVLWVLHYSYGSKATKRASVSRTLDNGQTWLYAEVTTNGLPYNGIGSITGTEIADLSVLDEQKAWLLKYDVVSGKATMARTTAGPTEFKDMTAELPARFQRVHFFTADIGVAFAAPAAGATAWPLYRTTDGGATWKALENTPLLAPTGGETIRDKQHFANSLWLVTSTNMLLRTADAGLTWSAHPVAGKVAFENALNGLCYQLASSWQPQLQQLLRTADGGLTWTAVAFRGDPLFTTITAVPGLPGTYLSGGRTRLNTNVSYVGVAAISRDQGESWQRLTTDESSFDLMRASDAAHLWASTAASFGNPAVKEQSLLRRYASTILTASGPTSAASRAVAYPNPTAGLLRIAGSLQGEEEVRVYDGAGRLCQRSKVSGARPALELTAQPAGLYQLVFTTASGGVRYQRVSKL